MYELWKNLFTVSSVLFVISLALIVVFKFLKNVYFHEYHEDELFKKESNDLRRMKNYIYSPASHTRQYIKKYALCKSGRDRYIVCNFVEPYHFITYYVIGYTKRKRVTEVLEIHEVNTTLSSKVICLNKRTRYVNIVVARVDGVVINSNVIKPIPKSKIRLHSLLASICCICGLYSFRHILLLIIARNGAKYYYESVYNYIGLIAMAIIFILVYCISFGVINKRNAKNRKGGALEYEFF